MPSYLVTETLNASPQAIWPVLADVVRWADWTPTISRVRGLSVETLEPGAQFEVHQPKLRPAVWTVTALEPGQRFTWEARSPGLRMRADHRLIAASDTQTTLELRFTFEGWLGPLVGWLARGVTMDYMRTEAAQLKRRVEG